jgi:hypothetical protein
MGRGGDVVDIVAVAIDIMGSVLLPVARFLLQSNR